MRKSTPLFLTVILLAALTCGSNGRETQVANALTVYLLQQVTCPEQVFLDPAGCPVALDTAKIAVDPYTNKPCLLAWKLVVENSQWAWSGKYCDPDSDPMNLTAEGAPLVNHNDGTFTISGAIGPAGQIIYATMTLTDKPPAGDAYTRKGTVAIIAVKKNNAPSLCGGLP